jgi:Na+-transporting methylmalonyl-CoA/oxaloacetate decarboxylase beta subunit
MLQEMLSVMNNSIEIKINIICYMKKRWLYMDIDIIGGADGPTTIFVSSGTSPYAIVIIAILCITVAVIIAWSVRKRKRKQ